MRSTNIKNYLIAKENEFKEIQDLYVKASISKTHVVYQNFAYTARALEGKLKRIQNQIKGAINISENINTRYWKSENLVFIENLANEEFACHVTMDSKFLSMKLELIVKKVIEEMGVSSNELLIKRLTGVKDYLIFNIKYYNEYGYKAVWIRDRYFEIAAFIDFKNDIPFMEYSNENSIYDMITFGDKTLEEMSKAGLFFDVLANRRKVIQDKTNKDIFFEKHQ